MSVLSILNQLAATSSRLEKEAILRQNRENKELKQTFALALDPLLNFYIKKIPSFTTAAQPGYNLLEAYDSILEGLSTRKYTGLRAIEYLSRTLSQCMPDDAEVLTRVIDRDLRCGVQAVTVNKIWPGLVKEFPVMLASKISDIDMSKFFFPAILQLKSDGMRVQIVHNNGIPTLYSRNGKELNVRGAFDGVFSACDEWVLDGELLAMKDGKPLPRTIGNGICNKAIKGTISEEEAGLLHVILWDAIPKNSWRDGEAIIPYKERLGALQTILNYDLNDPTKATLMDTRIVDDMDEAMYFFNQARSRGEEGVMLKDPAGPWQNKRVKHQIKLKGVYDADLRCVGWEPGTKKNQGKIGAYLLETTCGRLKVAVGTGLTDEDREADPREAVGKIIAIQYNDVVKDKRSDTYSLFLPRFLEVREDKDTADSLEDLVKQVREE